MTVRTKFIFTNPKLFQLNELNIKKPGKRRILFIATFILQFVSCIFTSFLKTTYRQIHLPIQDVILSIVPLNNFLLNWFTISFESTFLMALRQTEDQIHFQQDNPVHTQ